MTIRISIQNPLPKLRVPDATAFALGASFLDDSTDPWAARAPDSVDYRIDRVFRGEPQEAAEIKAWTPLTAAESVSIEVSAADNDIPDDHSADEYRRITIRANAGTQAEATATYHYCIEATHG